MHVTRPLTRRSVLAGVAATSIAVAVLPAGAATTTTTPAQGIATSTVTLLKLEIAGQTVTTGQVTALADNAVSPHKVQLVVTPLDSTATGPIGQQTFTPSSTPATVAAPSTAVTLPGGLGSVTGPAMQVGAQDSASGLIASVTATALGTVNLLNVPLDLQASSLSDTAKVVADSASAAKTLSVGTIALPSISDLLKALGLDLTKTLDQLTQGNLTKLVGLVGGDVATLNAAVDTAQAAIGSGAADSLSAAQTALGTAQTNAAAAQTALNAANTAFTNAWNTAYGALLPPAKATLDAALSAVSLASPLTATQFLALSPATLAAVTTAFGSSTVTSLTSLATAVQTAQAALSAANAAVTLVNNLVNALQALINAVLADINADTNPLASIGGIKLTTSAVAASTPTADAAVTVGTLDVLGTASTVSTFTSALAGVTGTLTDVLNTVGVTFTPPTISAGTPQHSTSTSGTTRKASASITGLTINLPTLSVPAALSLTGTAVSTPAGSLIAGVLSEVAQWTPASTSTTPGTTKPPTKQPTGNPSTTPGTPSGGPSLAGTGGNMVLPLVASLLIGAAFITRRRFAKPPQP